MSQNARAIQQMINRDDKQLIAQLSARVAADKSAILLIQLPRTINIDVPLLGFGLAFDKAK